MTARPSSLLLGVALLFGVLQSAPGVSLASAFTHAYLFAPLATLWFVLTVASHRIVRPWTLVLALALSAIGFVSVLTGTAMGIGARGPVAIWWDVLAAPLLIFVGLQWVDDREVNAARRGTRLVLFFAAALQVLFYYQAAGTQLLSPDFVFAHHTDIDWWTRVGGRVLGNPNNASPVFCAGFGWAVAERALGRRGVGNTVFLLVTGLAIWVTASRGAILTGLLLAVLAVGLRQGRRWLLWVAGAGAVALLAGSVDWTTDISFATTGADQSLADRWHTRLAAIPVVLAHPFGTGVGSTAGALHDRLFTVFQGSNYNGATSHDLLLNWGVSLGWVGLLLLVGALVIAFRRAVRTAGWLPVLPLVGFMVAAESAGVDVLNATNPAWAAMLWMLLGLAWRGRVVPSQEALEDHELHGQCEADRGARQVGEANDDRVRG